MLQDLYLHIQGRTSMLISKPIIAFPYLAISNQKRLFYIYSLHNGYQINSRTGQVTGPNIYLIEWNLKSQVFTQYQITPQQIFEAYISGYTKFVDLLSGMLPAYLLSSSLRIISIAYVILNDSVIGYVGNDMSQQSKYFDAAINLITAIKTTYEKIHKQTTLAIGPIYTLALISTMGTRHLYSPELQLTPANTNNLDTLTKLVQKYQESALSVGISAYTVSQTPNIPAIVHKVSSYDRSQGMWIQKIVPGIPSNVFDLNAISVLDESFLKELTEHIDQYTKVSSQELYEYANTVLAQTTQSTITAPSIQQQPTVYKQQQKPISQYTIPDLNLNAEIVSLEQKQEGDKLVTYITLRIEQSIQTSTRTEEQKTVQTAGQTNKQTQAGGTEAIVLDNAQTLESLDQKLANTLEQETSKTEQVEQAKEQRQTDSGVESKAEASNTTFEFDDLFGSEM